MLPQLTTGRSAIDVRYLVRDRNFISSTNNLREVAKKLGATVLDDARDLNSFLHLPDTLNQDDIPSFRDLLTSLVTLGHDLSDLAVIPDAHLRLRFASDLFDPRITLFKTSLYPSQLLHPTFEAMADQLKTRGLRG